MLYGMNSSEQPVALPLDYAAELAMEILLMRGECGDAAKALVEALPSDDAGLEECAVLDEALARAQRILHGAVTTIRQMRAVRRPPAE
jgi:hypothetical protein